jgi:hypothetical protein
MTLTVRSSFVSPSQNQWVSISKPTHENSEDYVA